MRKEYFYPENFEDKKPREKYNKDDEDNNIVVVDEVVEEAVAGGADGGSGVGEEKSTGRVHE